MSQSQLQEVAQGMSRLLLQHKQCEAWLATGRNEQAQALASSTLHLASSLPAPVQALGQHHIWRMRLNEVLLRACIASGKDWLLVLSTAKRLQPVYEMVYPKVRHLSHRLLFGGCWCGPCTWSAGPAVLFAHFMTCVAIT